MTTRILAALLLIAAVASAANAGDTLAHVQSRSAVRCGVSEGPVGFSVMNQEGGSW